MRFSARLPIAVHILLATKVFEAQHKITSEFLSASIGVNAVIVRNLLGRLKASGFVEVSAGVGGAKLLKPLDKITLLDIFNSVEPEEPIFNLHENPNPNCLVGRNIHSILMPRLDDVKRAAYNSLAAVTLQDLLDEIQRLDDIGDGVV